MVDNGMEQKDTVRRQGSFPTIKSSEENDITTTGTQAGDDYEQLNELLKEKD